MIINGIDLGGQGAICSLFVSDEGIVEGFVFKDLSDSWNPYDKAGKDLSKSHSEVNRLSRDICSLSGHTFIEDVKPYKGMSALTAHSFSGNIAMIYTLMALHGKEFTSIHAKNWQSLLDLETKSKDKELHKIEIRDKLLLKYPEAEKHLYTPRGRFIDGRSDALGIAHAGLIALKNEVK